MITPIQWRKSLGWVIALCALGLVGCATHPKVELPPHLDVPPAAELTDVPFFPQGEYQCGPASLAMALQWSGVDVTPEQLKPQVYTPSRKGSLPPDMIGTARRHGRLAYPVNSMEALLKEVAEGHPVIVLQRLSSFMRSSWHYAVVIGYDLDRRKVILHSGMEERETLSFEEFAATWQAWGRWGILTLAPGRFPATVQEEAYLKAAIGLEQTGRWPEAEQAYSQASSRWPESGTLWVGLGNSRYAQNNLSGAEKAFRAAVKADPALAASFNNLAHVLMELGRYEEALTTIDQAIALNGPLIETFQKTRTEILQKTDGPPVP